MSDERHTGGAGIAGRELARTAAGIITLFAFDTGDEPSEDTASL